MPLSDADVERWSRQIVLPEVGGRGQETLLGARVAVGGDGDAAAAARELLARAGVGRVERARATTGDVAVELDAHRAVVGAGATVTTLVGRPCVACAAVDAPRMSLGAPAAVALGALVAAETLRVLLTAPATGRRTTLPPGASAVELPTTSGCARCGAAA
jgi:hypothetical protein